MYTKIMRDLNSLDFAYPPSKMLELAKTYIDQVQTFINYSDEEWLDACKNKDWSEISTAEVMVRLILCDARKVKIDTPLLSDRLSLVRLSDLAQSVALWEFLREGCDDTEIEWREDECFWFAILHSVSHLIPAKEVIALLKCCLDAQEPFSDSEWSDLDAEYLAYCDRVPSEHEDTLQMLRCSLDKDIVRVTTKISLLTKKRIATFCYYVRRLPVTAICLAIAWLDDFRDVSSLGGLI